MAQIKDYKSTGAPFGNETKIVKVTYDVAVDGGGTGAYEILKLEDECLVELKNIDCVEAFATTTGVIDMGIGPASTDFRQNLDPAIMILDSQLSSANPAGYSLAAAGSEVVMTIETAAVTAGKAVLTFLVSKR